MESSNVFNNQLDSMFQAMGTGSLVAGIFAIIGVFLVLAIIMYIFTSLGLYAMANTLNIEYPWLVWIPIANIYILGKIVGDKIKIFGYEITNLGIVLIVSSLVLSILTQIPFVGFIILIAYEVFIYFIYYKLYRMFKPESAGMYLVLSIVFSIVQPFLIFSIRNNKPDMTVFEE